MADTMPTPDDEGSLFNLPTLFLAFVTLAVYLLFLKPTARDDDDTNGANNNNHNNSNTTNAMNANNNNAVNRATARERHRQRGGGRRLVPQQPARRRLQMSENAMEVLGKCQSIPPHVLYSSKSKSSSASTKTIGGFDILSENGLVAFSHTRAAFESSSFATTATTTKGSGSDAPASITMSRANSSSDSDSCNSNNNNNNNNNNKNMAATAASTSLLQRKERAKILSRLFAATSKDDVGKGLPAPPAKGSTFVIGISREKHLIGNGDDQLSSLRRAIKGLAAHYTVLVVVSLGSASSNSSNSSSYEPTEKLHSEIIGLLRGETTTELLLSESVLPSHRVLLAGSAKGRVALVRQLSTNIGLTVDYDTDVREELERFGYEVSIVEDWKMIIQAKDAAAAAAATKP